MITIQKLSIHLDELELSRQQVEFLQALVEGQGQQIEFLQDLVEGQDREIFVKEQQLQSLQQELDITNTDLCQALAEQEIDLVKVEQFTQTGLVQEKSLGKCLAELLSAVGSFLKVSEELEPLSHSIVQIIPSTNFLVDRSMTHSSQLKESSKQLKTQLDKLKSNFIQFKTQYLTSQECRKKLITQSRETKELSKNLRLHLNFVEV